MIASLQNLLRIFIFSIFLLNCISISFAQDCTDVISTRQVENTNDNCGSWCNGPYVFTLGPGECYIAGDDLTFTEYTNGTALLSGSVLKNGNIGQLSVTFTGGTNIAPVGSPKYMLCIDNGGDFWHFYPDFSGVFTYPNGNSININKHGPAFQVGYGANVQDTQFGASGWFNHGSGHDGDLNFQLSSPIECEEEGIFLDAECAIVGNIFNTINDLDASHQAALTVEPGNNAYNNAPTSSNDRIRFNVDISKNGAYNIFARVKAPSGYDDSFWVRVNNEIWVKWNDIQTGTAFIWDQVHDFNNDNTPVAFYLETGNNTIDFAYREDGTILDQIYITQDLNAPVGLGQDATNCACFSEVNIACNSINNLCNGIDSSSIELEISGTSSNFDILWSNGATTQNLTNLTPGTYTVTVTGDNNCTATCEATILPLEPFSIECESTDVVCGDENSGTGSVTVTGGVGPYIYHWSNNACTEYEDGLATGTYTITVSDTNGCEEVCTINVGTSEANISATATSSDNTNCQVDICDELCFESSNGNNDVNAKMAISYNVAGDEVTIRTTYSKTFCDNTYGNNTIGWPANNHTFRHVHKSDHLELALYNSNGNESLKFALDFIHEYGDGTFATGGIEDGDGEMINGNAAHILEVRTSMDENFNTFGYILTTSSPLTDNFYTVNPSYPNWIYEMWYEVTVDVSAFGTSGFGYPEITNFHASPSKTGNDSEPLDLIGCCGDGCTGAIDLTVTTGEAPFSFLWSNGELTEDIDGLCEGQYTVTVIDANGCSTIFSYDVELGSSIELTCEASSPSCDQASSGSVTTSIEGGNGNYSFLWSNGDTTQNLENIPAGTYSVSVTDVNGCEETCSVEVISEPSILITCTVGNNACEETENGMISTQVNGGDGSETYLWSNGATTQNLENVSAGIYSVTVTKSNGCSASCETEIEETPSFDISCTSTNTSCNSSNDGTVTVSTNFGIPPFSFEWSNGNMEITQQDLEAGIYAVTVTDANGCIRVCESEVISNDPINITCSINENICNGNQNASITTEVVGGSGNYNFQWNNGNTTQNLDDINPGIYEVTVTDQNGCSASCLSIINQIDLFSITCDATNTSCGDLNDGSIEIITNGGTAPFSYLWDNESTDNTQQNLTAGIYTVTVTDANNCSQVCSSEITSNSLIEITCTSQENPCNGNNSSTIATQVIGGTGNYTFLWSNGATSQNLENVSPGTYSVTVSDENGCPAVCETTIESLAVLSATCSSTNITCNGNSDGTLTVSVNGGTAPYIYNWNNGNTNDSQSNLIAGTYTVTITDANGCETSCSTEITSNDLISLSCNAQNATCESGSTSSITTSVSGGSGNYTFLWSNGATSESLENIASGTYSVTVTDENGCEAICHASIENTDALTANCEATDLACGEANTGIIILNVSGGSTPYTFQWSNGATSQNLDNIDGGNYSVTITDANACSTTCETIVGSPAPVIVISNATSLLCFGDSTATADLHIEGGVAPYTYLWDNGSTEPVIENLSAGFYGVTVTDANGCTGICGPWVVNPDPINVSFENTIVTCHGGNDGSISSIVSGGNGAYTFEWSNGSTTQDLSGLEAGEYTLTVSDENGCSNIFTTTIESNAELISNCSSTPLSCHQNNTGSILLNVTGGSGNYTFLWNSGATTQNLENLSSGQYTVTITDENGCSTNCSTFIEEPTLLSVNCTANQLFCGAANTGSINISVEGGTPPYAYQWDNGATSQNITDLDAGTYEITVIDANDCTTTCSAIINTANPIIAACNGQDLYCGEENTGSVEVIINGGTAPFTFTWSNGATSQNLSNLNAGTYDVTINDANGCEYVCSTTIVAIDALTANCQGQDLLCGTANSGNIDLVLSGGTAPFTYLWSNGATTQNLEEVNEGTYSVTVTDVNGCIATCGANLNIIAPIQATCTAQNLECGVDQTGSISASATGGTAPFSYFWSNGTFTQTQTNLSAGEYTVTIADANGCTATCTSIIEADPMLNVVCNADGVTCGNSNSGNIDIDVSGGVEPFSFLWNTGATTEDLLNIPSGTYSVTVTDVNGCIVSCSTTVEVSLGLNLSCLAENTVCGESLTGSVDLTVSGGTGNYTFEWSNGATTEDLSELDPGTYTVTVSDTNGCTGICSSSVSQTTELEAVCDASEIPCGGQPDGSIDVTVTGGTGDYTYEWNNGATTEDLDGVSAGTYSVTVSDSNGCTTTCSTTITEAPGLSLTCIKNNITCRNANDGNISTSVAGGTEPYSFLWSTGDTLENLENLSTGSYTLTVTDANGCSTTCSSLITQPAALLVIPSANDITCNGNNNGTGFATVLGGTQPYSYEWSTGATTSFINNLSEGTYTLTVTDANGCQNVGTISISEPSLLTSSIFAINENCQPASGAIDLTVEGGTAPYTYLWNTEDTSEDLFNIAAGTYTVIITDSKGCETINSIIVESGNPIILTCTPTAASCGTPSVGNIDLAVSGGTGPYTFLWSNGSDTEDINNIPAGNYTVTVTDSFGCSSICTSEVEAAPSLTLELTTNNIDCNGASNGSITATVQQGMPPFSYNWSNGATSETIENLNAGNYSLTVTDVNGCQGFSSTTITQPSSLLVVISSTPLDCGGDNDATAFVTVIGGMAPYQYAWNTGATSPFINALSAGTYMVTVTDNNGCQVVNFTIVEEPAPINISFNSNQLTCQEDNNGSVETTISGGAEPYTYEWSNGASTKNIDLLSAGTYNLTVTDTNGCSNTNSVTISAQNPLVVSCTAEDVLCTGESNGQVNLQVTGGQGPYTYLWDDGSTEGLRTDIAAGQYFVTVTDNNGCSSACSTTVAEPNQLIADYGSTNVTCDGETDGILEAVAEGGVAPYTFEWSTGDSTEMVEGLPAGAYGLTLSDANGCIFICGLIINEPLAISCGHEISTASSGSPDLSDITMLSAGGTGTLSYSIDDGINFQTSPVFEDVEPGIYTVKVIDENGCFTECGPITVVQESGLIEEEPMTDLSPNPATTELKVVHEAVKEGFTIFEVKNMAGKVVYTKQTNVTKGKNAFSINTARLPNGTYVLAIYSDASVSSQQFIVLKNKR